MLLQLDNQTAVAYINNMGETVSPHLTDLAKALWMWALSKDIVLSVELIPGDLNDVADAESRSMKDRTEWKLHSKLFRVIDQQWGSLEVDLFASRLSNQLPRYFSWRPDPLAEATDAFSQQWQQFRGYAYPDRQSSLSSEGPTDSGDPGGPSMEGPTLVSSPTGNALQLSSAASSTAKPVPANLQCRSDGPSTPTSCLACLRQKFGSENLSEAAKELLFKSWRTKTSRAYDSHFRKWLGWCAEQNVDPISGPTSDVVNFLADLHAKGY